MNSFKPIGLLAKAIVTKSIMLNDYTTDELDVCMNNEIDVELDQEIFEKIFLKNVF